MWGEVIKIFPRSSKRVSDRSDEMKLKRQKITNTPIEKCLYVIALKHCL